MTSETIELREAWHYEFQYWEEKFDNAKAVRLVISKDKSESYEMDRFHVFELDSGKYATVYECGCSCYDVEDARVELFPNEALAVEKYLEWLKTFHEVND